MAIAFRSYVEFNGTHSSPPDLGKPVGTLSTDVLIAEFGTNDPANPATMPAGWTQIASISATNVYDRLQIFWALGSVASVQPTNATIVPRIRITAWSGVDTTTPIRAYATLPTETSNADYPAPSITVTAGDAVLAIWYQGQSFTAIGSPPAGFTDISQLTNSANYRFTASYQLNAAGGATGDLYHNADVAWQYKDAATIGLAAASGGGGAGTARLGAFDTMLVRDIWFDESNVVNEWYTDELVEPVVAGAVNGTATLTGAQVTKATGSISGKGDGSFGQTYENSLVGITTAYGNDFAQILSAPSSGMVFGAWSKVIHGAYPWNHGNADTIRVYGPDWSLLFVTNNSNAASALDTECRYNANSMLIVNDVWIGDYCYYGESVHTAAEVEGWTYNAWQIVIGATDMTVRQWIKLGLNGTLILNESVIPFSVVGGWNPAAPNKITVGGNLDSSDPTQTTRVKVYASSTLPSDSFINSMALTEAADTGAWADWEYAHKAGAPVLTDRSGNARNLTTAGSLTAGPPGPIASGTPLVGATATASAGTITASASSSSNGTATLAGTSATSNGGTIAATGSATKTLTGTGTTSGVGSITASASRAVTLIGTGAASGVGAITSTGSATKALTGVGIASGVGTITASGSTVVNGTATLTGTSATSAVGALTSTGTATKTLTGVQVASGVGSITASASRAVALTGTGATSSVGSVTSTGTATKTLTGAGVTSGIGSITASASRAVTLTGAGSTSSAGAVTPTGTATTTLTGAATTASAGTIFATGGVVVNGTATLIGTSATSNQGTISATGGAARTLTGAPAASGVGSLTSTGSATRTLTGAPAASAVGSITASASRAVALTGIQVTSNRGSLAATGSATKTLTGTQVTASAGTITGSVSKAATLTGVQVVSGVGTITASASRAATLTGASSTSSVGALTATGTATKVLTGAAATASAGTIAAVGAGVGTANIPGVGVTSSAGSIAAKGGASKTLTGATATASAGTITASMAVSAPLTGTQRTSAAGSISAQGSATKTLTGVGATSSVGAITAVGVTPNASAQLAGASAVSAAGLVRPTGGATKALTGTSATSNRGVITATGGAAPDLNGSTATSGAGTFTPIGFAEAALTGTLVYSGIGSIGTFISNGLADPKRTFTVAPEVRGIVVPVEPRTSYATPATVIAPTPVSTVFTVVAELRRETVQPYSNKLVVAAQANILEPAA